MLYSVPYKFIKRKVDVRITDKVVEIIYNHNHIAACMDGSDSTAQLPNICRQIRMATGSVNGLSGLVTIHIT